MEYATSAEDSLGVFHHHPGRVSFMFRGAPSHPGVNFYFSPKDCLEREKGMVFCAVHVCNACIMLHGIEELHACDRIWVAGGEGGAPMW